MMVSSRLRWNGSALLSFSGMLCACAVASIMAFAPAAGADAPSDSYIVVLKDDVVNPTNVANRHEKNRGAKVEDIYGVAVKGYSAELTAAELNAIQQDPAVDYVEKNGTLTLDAQETPLALSRIFATSNPNLDIDGVDDIRSDVDIAILDTGVSLHPDLNIVSRVNCSELESTSTSTCSTKGVEDVVGHGTHVAGLAGAIDNNFGIVGTAPGARIWSVKVTPAEGDETDTAAALLAFDWVAAHSGTIEVVNMSWSCEEVGGECNGTQTAMREAIAASVNKGVVFVGSAGNLTQNISGESEGPEGTPTYPIAPARFPDVIAVSALEDTDGVPGGLGGPPSCTYSGWSFYVAGKMQYFPDLAQDDSLANFSNWGPAVDIAAPGTCIRSTWKNGEYKVESGTSMSAPLVAGAVAGLAAAKNPNNRAEVEAIRNFVRSLGNYNWTDLHQDQIASQKPTDWAFAGDGVQEPLLDMGGVASQSKPPTVWTNPADEVNATSARLNGFTYAENSPTTYRFEYGTSTAYGSVYPPLPGWDGGSGANGVFCWNRIEGLAPGTTYHYRLTATNANGTTYGNDQAFTTAATTTTKPSVTYLPVTDLTRDGAVLNGQVNPNGAATKYYFQLGETTNYDTVLPPNTSLETGGVAIGAGNSPVGVSERALPLDLSTTYHYRLVARNAYGTTFGSDQTFTTPGFLPVAITKEPTEVDEKFARLQGIVGPSGAPTSYYFQFGTTTAYGSNYPSSPASVTDTINSSRVAYGLPTVQPGTTYHYRLVATNPTGTVVGEDMTFTTLSAQTPRVEASPPGEITQSKITMAAKADVRGLAGTYYFEYGSNERYGFKTGEANVPPGGGLQLVTADAQGLPTGQTIHYRVVVANSDRTVKGPDQVATSGWRNEPSSAPKSAKEDWLKDVSCPNAGSCIAVGGYVNSTTGNTAIAAEQWNGTEWTAMEPPVPAGTFSELRGVDCLGPSNCIAVGYATPAANSARALIMKWNGTAWSEVSVPALPSGEQHYLNDIDCPSALSCEAVGRSLSNTSLLNKALALHFDGSAWSVRAAANPTWPGGEPAKEGTILEGVSCASPTFCKAVGMIIARIGGVTTTKPLIERLNGSEWLNEAADTSYLADFGHTNFRLSGVSCPTTATCFAVGGSSTDASGTSQWPFVQRWSAGAWAFNWAPLFKTSTSTSLGSSGLYAVSCSSATSCRAVGADGIGVRWSGSGYWLLEVPKTPPGAVLTNPIKPLQATGISCPTASECHAVGTYGDATPAKRRLTQGWSGSSAVPRTLGDSATPIGEFGATLRGFVDPAGVDANYYFEYGLTTSYGTDTAEVAAGSSSMGLNTGSWAAASTAISELDPGRTYHYRVVATNGISTTYGPDTTFTTKSALGALLATEAFAGTTTAVSNFGTKWAVPKWIEATRKGSNTATGYAPADTAANGAYFMSPVTDTGKSSVTEPGPGTAAQATIAVGPGVGGRISLWSEMTAPTTNKTGYELALTETAANTYTVALKSWAVSETLLGSITGVSLPAGSKVALVDVGTSVSAFADTGSGMTRILTKTNASLMGGYAGVEVQGATSTRVNQFKYGLLNEKAASFDAAAKALSIADGFTREESPLSLSSAWAALNWATATPKTGKSQNSAGWIPSEVETIGGAYWQKPIFSDTGSGNAIVATHGYAYGINPVYYGLWLDMPSPTTAKSGYQLRVAETSIDTLELKIIKWVNGTATTLGTKTGLKPTGGSKGTKLALVVKNGVVSAWSAGPGGNFTQAIAGMADSTYSSGYAGIEGFGPALLRDVRFGALAPY